MFHFNLAVPYYLKCTTMTNYVYVQTPQSYHIQQCFNFLL